MFIEIEGSFELNVPAIFIKLKAGAVRSGALHLAPSPPLLLCTWQQGRSIGTKVV